MSEHTNETTIQNQAETIRRLVAERDEWRQFAMLLYATSDEFVSRVKLILEQKGGA